MNPAPPVAQNDALNELSFIGVARSMWGYNSPLALTVGGLLAVGALVGLVALWWRRGVIADRHERLNVSAMAATLAVLVLLPPHSMFYDSGLALVGLWWLADRVTASQGWKGRSGRWSPGGVDGWCDLVVGLRAPPGGYRGCDAVAGGGRGGGSTRRPAGMADFDAKSSAS
jgi:hypothetical protein